MKSYFLIFDAGIPYAVLEVDKSSNKNEIIAKLNEVSGMDTFPNLFVNGSSIKGCEDCKTLQHKGELLNYFVNIPRIEIPKDVRTQNTLFSFPELVNRKASQAAGLIATIICVLCVAFWEKQATKWVVLALAIDFFVRIFYGGNCTPIGLASQLLVCWTDPVFMAGPPKQFAAVCGFFMSGLSAALLLSGERLGGTIVIGLLIGPAGLEGFFDFCLGCWMFGLAINFGLVTPYIYRPYLNLFMDRVWAYNYVFKQPKQSEVPSAHLIPVLQKEETPVDLITKSRIESEYKNQDIHWIKHARVELFGWPLALAALAFVFKLTFNGFYNPVIPRVVGQWGTEPVFHAIGITSAVLFCFFGALYIIRFVKYPKKVWKEWNHPVAGNMFSAITICITMYGLMMFDRDLNFGIALVWIGSAAQMLFAVLRISSLIFDQQTDDMINPSIMMSPVANFICALAFATYQIQPNVRNIDGDVNYIMIARLWFAVASLFALIMFAVTFNKAIRDHHSDVRLRPTLWIWMATTAVAGPAYFSVAYDPLNPTDYINNGRGVIYQSFWLLTLFFFAVNCVGWLKGFFTYVQDMSIWIYAFSFSAMAISTVHYYYFVGDFFSRTLAIISIAFACTCCFVCAVQSVLWAIDGTLFKPKPKWGPMQSMKLTHEAFR